MQKYDGKHLHKAIFHISEQDSVPDRKLRLLAVLQALSVEKRSVGGI